MLVVEDDGDLRDLLARLLGKKGYRVLSAGSAPAVHAVLAGAGHIDLLPTDVVLPDGMSGKGVAAAVQARLPACRVL